MTMEQMENTTMNEDVYPVNNNGDIPAMFMLVFQGVLYRFVKFLDPCIGL